MSGFFLIPKKGTGGGAEAIPLIVTCSSQFAGSTITASDGTSTLTETCPSTSPYEITFILPNDGSWTISGTAGGQTFTTSILIEPYETTLNAIPEGSTVLPTDDIQTWLKCAGIFDKSYTTISEVLNDSSTITDLIASNNAADYMARSTTWASSVVVNSSAMTKIGANDYCADILLSDATWLNAICNSTYFESVLNVKIPTMTSNTDPSGVASAYRGNSSAWKAFDGIANINNKYSSGQKYQTDDYLRYEFTNAVCIKKWVVKKGNQSSGITIPMKIVGSNDGSNWSETLATNQQTESGDNIAILNNNTNYKYYQMIPTQNSSDAWYNIFEIQLYGRIL